MSILITGASGFVGRHLIKYLSKDQCKLRLLSRNQQDHDTIICNLETDEIPKNALIGVDTIFHLAGLSHDFRKDSDINDLYYSINVDATIKLAKLAVNEGIKKFVFLSSVKAGGSLGEIECQNEDNQYEPSGVYGKSKREAELKLLELSDKTNLNVTIIRSSLVYGPGVKGNLKLMLDQINRGWFPPLPETKNRRSMIHVDDLVRSLVFIANNRKTKGEIFIATDGIAYSSRGIYIAMCKVIKKPIPRWYVPKFIFTIACLISPSIKFKLNKLMGNEYYSSKKLKSLGFIAYRSIEDMNETIF